MRNWIAAVILVVTFSLVSSMAVQAQPGSKRAPKFGSNSAPPRQTAPRRSETDENAKAPQRPGVKFSSGTSSTEESEPTEGTDDRNAAAGPPATSRFGNRDEAPSEPIQEAEEAPAEREGFRSAGLDNRMKSRGNPSSRRLLEQAQESATESESTEPAPLSNRGAARSIEAQSINVSLNDTHAGVSLAFALNLEHAGAITGYPIRMEQLLAASPDGASRRAAIRAYWNLVISIADHHHALDEFDRIAQLASSSDDKLLEAAAAGAEARVAETKIIVTAAQFDLAAFTPSPATLPIPADAPLVGEYRTEYAALFGRGPAPVAIKRLSVMLPLYKDQVAARGRASYAASEALVKSEDLQTFKQLCDHRRAFLGAVRDYNEAIADYALQLATPGMSAEAVTSMLIVRTQPAADSQPDLSGNASRRGTEVIQASAAEPIEKSVIKPRRIGSFRNQEPDAEEPAGPDAEENESLKSDPEGDDEPVGKGPDMTEAPAGRSNWGSASKRNEE